VVGGGILCCEDQDRGQTGNPLDRFGLALEGWLQKGRRESLKRRAGTLLCSRAEPKELTLVGPIVLRSLFIIGETFLARHFAKLNWIGRVEVDAEAKAKVEHKPPGGPRDMGLKKGAHSSGGYTNRASETI